MFAKDKHCFYLILVLINIFACHPAFCLYVDTNSCIAAMDCSKNNLYFIKLDNCTEQNNRTNILYRTDDSGNNYETLSLNEFNLEKLNIYLIKACENFIMLISTFDTIDYSCSNLFISNNGGLSWTNIRFFKENKIYIYDALLEDSVFLLSTDKGIYKSTDEGIRWECDTLLPIRPYKTIVNDGDKKYYISDSIIYYIKQNKEIKSILPKQIVMGGNLIFINNEFYQADLKGIYYSCDNGNTWENITYNMPLPNFTQQIQIFKFRNSIYTLKKEGLYYYVSDKNYWLKLPLLKENKFFFSNNAVIFNGKLFLSSTRYGILKSDDGINFYSVLN